MYFFFSGVDFKEASANATKEITKSNLVISSFIASKQSPQYTGTSVKLTAQASGGKGTKQYKYYRYLNGRYATIKEWSTTNNVTITPSTEGTYDLWVAVKVGTGKIVRKNMKFTFIKPLGISSITTDKKSPQYTGTSVKLTVQAVGGKGTKQYKYYRYLNGNYAEIKNWSTTNNVTITPSTAGTYDLWVAVKDSKGTIIKKNIKFTFDKALGINSFTTDKVSPQCVGTSVKLTVQAVGGKGTKQYKYYRYLNGNYAEIKNWSTTNNVTITPSAAGTYDLWVAVKDGTGKIVKKNVKFSFNFNKVLEIKSLTTDKASPQVVGTQVVLTAKATGTGTLKYRFRVGTANGNSSLIKDYSTSNTATWKANYVGTKILYVDVKDGNGKVTTKTMTYVIADTPVEKKYKVNSDEYKQIINTEMYRLINEYRASKGIDALGINTNLQTLARLKNEHMIQYKYFDHSYNGKEIGQMYPELIPDYEKGCDYNNVLENLYVGGDSVDDQTKEQIKKRALSVFNLWKGSPLHDATMWSPDVTLIGFDYTVSNKGTAYATLEAYVY